LFFDYFSRNVLTSADWCHNHKKDSESLGNLSGNFWETMGISDCQAMEATHSQVYRFGDFRVDAAKRLLVRREDKPIALTPKVFDTLLYLVRNNQRVIEKDELMREIWADTIVEENNLNKNISILRRVLGEKKDEHRFIVTVPGRGYKFVAEVRQNLEEEKGRKGDEETAEADSPAEIKRNEKIQNPKSKIQNRIWLVSLTVLSVLSIGATVFYFWRGNEKSSDAPVKTIAVLPFKPLVLENRSESLELGMADALINKISSSGELIVRPLGSIRRYNNLEQDVLQAGRELGVDSVLDGTIQTSGDRIRVSARLIRTGDGKPLWAGQFDEKSTDIFAVQDSISERVLAALRLKLSGEAQRRLRKRDTENTEAYQLYMKGRFHSARLIQPETAKAVAYFQQAIELDPNYALAYVALADSYRRFSLSGDAPSSEAMPQAKAAAQRAIELDDSLADAHAALGIIAFWYDWDWQAAEKHFRRALELDPNNANAHSAYGHFLSNMARHDEALAEAKLSRELDPLTLIINATEGQILFFAGKSDEALDRLNKTIDLDANFWVTHLMISRVYIEKGMQPEAIAAASKARELSKVNSESIALIGYSQAKSGETDKARAVLDELLKLSAERYVPPYNFALVYNALGMRDEALDYLEKGFAEKDVRMVFLKIEPKWNNLRNEPRFIELMRRMNFE
jgi:serine/threonine-protein kinase